MSYLMQCDQLAYDRMVMHWRAHSDEKMYKPTHTWVHVEKDPNSLAEPKKTYMFYWFMDKIPKDVYDWIVKDIGLDDRHFFIRYGDGGTTHTLGKLTEISEGYFQWSGIYDGADSLKNMIDGPPDIPPYGRWERYEDNWFYFDGTIWVPFDIDYTRYSANERTLNDLLEELCDRLKNIERMMREL